MFGATFAMAAVCRFAPRESACRSLTLFSRSHFNGRPPRALGYSSTFASLLTRQWDRRLRLQAGQIEDQIAVVFAGRLTEADVETLRLSRQLRNKLLHGDFHQARERLHGLGVALRPGGVRKIQISPGDSVLQTIESGLANYEALPTVSDMTSTQAAGIFGWLLELSQSGALKEAERVFLRANEIVDRLMLLER
jgi:hypothetical protein